MEEQQIVIKSPFFFSKYQVFLRFALAASLGKPDAVGGPHLLPHAVDQARVVDNLVAFAQEAHDAGDDEGDEAADEAVPHVGDPE